MYGIKGSMISSSLYLFVALHYTFSEAGPVGPLPNMTSLDLGLKEGSCALGDVVYLPGDEFPGTSACERCACADGEVRCQKQRCEPRPGCKAVHRPDHCCPTYQCECEQEGRVYANGEKLVDPQDPCRVCYCQGGEVVCRRIACFVRDDCQPRLVPGRCCPEYDNCPLRGVTSVHGMTSVSSTTAPKVNNSALIIPTGHIKPGFTIKEITPVSEIPVTDIKVKEILPSPNMEVNEYLSSRSPLIPREVTSELTSIIEANFKPDNLVNAENDELKSSNEDSITVNNTSDSTPSKISFSTQDSINSEIYPSNIPRIMLMGAPSEPMSLGSQPTRAPTIEEEDSSLFDHNPAFPPIPDDLSVLGNHDDEILPEQHFENDHIPGIHDLVVTNNRIITDAPVMKESPTTTLYMTNGMTVTTDKLSNSDILPQKSTTTSDLSTTDSSPQKENAMINLRSVLPTQILDIPSFIVDDTTDDIETTTDNPEIQSSSPGKDIETTGNDNLDASNNNETSSDFETPQSRENIVNYKSSTEIFSDNQPSSLFIETSDQNPQDTLDKISDSTLASSTKNPIILKLTSMAPGKDLAFENMETTEFILTSFGSQESATDTVELIKTSPNSDKRSALIEPSHPRTNNILTDLINLVGDVASIGDHTDNPAQIGPGSTTISDSEELIPVNIGYKSKNNNWNLNSITEIPLKSKNMLTNKLKNVEIEDDDDTDNITDSLLPNEKIEPTTKRPIIDNVADNKQQHSNETVDKKDIEIITQAYVPSINRRPTKVVMEGSEEIALPEKVADTAQSSASAIGNEEIDPNLDITTEMPSDAEEATEQPFEDISPTQ